MRTEFYFYILKKNKNEVTIIDDHNNEIKNFMKKLSNYQSPKPISCYLVKDDERHESSIKVGVEEVKQILKKKEGEFCNVHGQIMKIHGTHAEGEYPMFGTDCYGQACMWDAEGNSYDKNPAKTLYFQALKKELSPENNTDIEAPEEPATVEDKDNGPSASEPTEQTQTIEPEDQVTNDNNTNQELDVSENSNDYIDE